MGSGDFLRIIVFQQIYYLVKKIHNRSYKFIAEVKILQKIT